MRDPDPRRARLLAPSVRHAPSFLVALREGFRRGQQARRTLKEIAEIEADSAGYIERVTEQRSTIELPGGRVADAVPFSLHWMVLDDEFVGELSFRHRLNDWLTHSGGHVGYGIRPSMQGRGFGKRILALGIVEARRLGLQQLLVTCRADNHASARVIEANGGELDGIEPDIFSGEPLRRYWITTAGSQ